VKPSATSTLAASIVAGTSGKSVRSSPITSSLTRLGAEQLAAQARGGDRVVGGEAAGRVGRIEKRSGEITSSSRGPGPSSLVRAARR
jgi:hypothetical protein